ncbi:unnamed protein product [Clonostachys rosea]|uniref:Transcription factor domain-containing protein n=1 Tax=Bionectria ochroleuca TaxID=29856 RepID=A0ABY6V2J2_BIOOC|nr:unnamed protein product [Clonostachys rosea]
MRTSFAESVDTCLVVLVCALGAVASRFLEGNQWPGESDENAGLSFFDVAQEMLLHVEGPDWASVQLFFSSKLRVYDAWRFIHRACSTILILVPLQDQLEAHQAQLFWIAYLQESQLLAEFDFPPSGLGKLAGSVALPLVPDAGTDPHHAKYQFFFLALISMRKLLNRVLYHVYKQDPRYDEAPRPTSSPGEERFNAVFSANKRIIEELDRQLEEWRNCLPAGLNFPSYSPLQEPPPLTEPHEPRSIDDRLRGHLLARYYVAKSILHRPFLYRVLHSEHNATMITENDRLGATVAIHSAFLSTLHSGLFHEPLPLLLHPINSWRSMFALDLQVAFCRHQDPHHFALPKHYESIGQIRRQLSSSSAHSCPTLNRDEEILLLLE